MRRGRLNYDRAKEIAWAGMNDSDFEVEHVTKAAAIALGRHLGKTNMQQAYMEHMEARNEPVQ